MKRPTPRQIATFLLGPWTRQSPADLHGPCCSLIYGDPPKCTVIWSAPSFFRATPTWAGCLFAATAGLYVAFGFDLALYLVLSWKYRAPKAPLSHTGQVRMDTEIPRARIHRGRHGEFWSRRPSDSQRFQKRVPLRRPDLHLQRAPDRSLAYITHSGLRQVRARASLHRTVVDCGFGWEHRTSRTTRSIRARPTARYQKH